MQSIAQREPDSMTHNVPSDDQTLIQQLIERHEPALSQLYTLYGNRIYGLAYRILGDSHRAEEVTQDVFMRLWEQPGSWDPDKGVLIAWLLGITRYAAIDRLRKDKSYETMTHEHIDELHSDIADDTLMVGTKQWRDAHVIQQFMHELPVEQMEVIQLAFFKGMTHSELAEKLNLPLGTIKTRIRLGLQKLRGMWATEVEEYDD